GEHEQLQHLSGIQSGATPVICGGRVVHGSASVQHPVLPSLPFSRARWVMAEKYTSVEALASYAIGRQAGEQLTGQPFPALVPEALLDGLGGVLKGESCPYKDEELRGALDELNRRVMRMQQQQASASAAMGEQFLKENAQKPGITTTESGLQYEVLKEGKGPK